MNKHSREKTIVGQGLLLAAAGMITKIIGFLYRIPMANILGEEGNGIYSVAFGIYNIALTLSSYSLPLAVSKLLSFRLARGERKNASKLFRLSLEFALCAGTLAFLFLFLGADMLEDLYTCPGLSRPLRVLALTAFIVAFLGVLRGYFQGHGDMVPTGISQVFEQVVNAVVSVLAAFLLSAHALREQPDQRASFAAAGGTLGTLSGAVGALLVLLVLFRAWKTGRLKHKKEEEESATEEPAEEESGPELVILLVATILPVIVSQTIYQIGYTIDDLVFGRLMSLKGITSEAITSLRGVFNTQYNQMVNLPVAVASAMAASTIPGIVRALAKDGQRSAQEKAERVLQFNMAIAFPAAVGLAVLSDPIMGILFPRLTGYHELASNLLLTGSSAVIFYALSTLSTAILQAMDKMKTPVFHSGVSLVIHIVLISVLLLYTDLGVYALIIGNVTFPLGVCSLNLLSLRRLGFRFNFTRLLIKPLLASSLMGILAFVSYRLLSAIPHGLFGLHHHLIPTALSILLSSAFYFLLARRLGILEEFRGRGAKRSESH